jgi:hypothetical protein
MIQTHRLNKAHVTTLNLNNFKTIEAMGLKEVPLNDIISVPNFTKIYQVVHKLLVGDIQRDTCDLSLLYFFGN